MHRSFAAATVLLVLGSILPAAAQDDLGDARAQREALRAEAAATAAAIDELEAEDATIVEALEQIDAWIAVQESRLDRARQELAVKRDIEAEANARAADLEQQIVDLEAEVTAQLIEGYLEGFENNDELLLRADDINTVPILRFVLDETAGLSIAATDLLRLARDEQADAIEEAEAASADAETIAAGIEDQIVELDQSRADQERLRAEVDARIGLLEEEAAILADEDAKVTAFIRAEEERIRREEEERRRAEEEARRRAEAERLRAEEEERRQAEEERLEEERRQAEEDAAAEEDQDPEDPGDDEEAPDDEPADDEPAEEPAPEPEPEPEPSGEVPSFSHPVSGGISSPYGFRIHPIYGTSRLHTGVDYNSPSGAPIGSAAPGTVIFVGTFSGYGNTVMVSHSGGYSTLYAHMSGFNTSTGASVGRGDTLGFVGSTGLSTGPHLHFEIRLNGSAIDPAPLM